MNNQPADPQSDETRLTGELDRLMKEMGEKIVKGIYISVMADEVYDTESLENWLKIKLLAWHETEKQKSTKLVDRFEVIDHRKCFYCRGSATTNYRQKDGSYKQQLCDKCDGSGIKGGRVYGAFSNPETSIMEIDLSFQDDGKTLKVFVKDKECK